MRWQDCPNCREITEGGPVELCELHWEEQSKLQAAWFEDDLTPRDSAEEFVLTDPGDVPTAEMIRRLQQAVALLATEIDEPSGRSVEEQIERMLYPEHFPA